jgi:hypothetical protein
MAGSTGQGTTVALSGGGAITCLRSLTLPEWSMEEIDTSCLSDTGFTKKIVSDLVDAGSVSMTLVFDLTDSPVTPDSESDTLTVTFPTPPGGTSGATLAGTGYVLSCTLPEVTIGGLLEQTVVFVFDGATGPTWTAAT